MRPFFLLLCLPLIGAAPPEEQIVDGDNTVAVKIAGRPLRLRIEAAAPGLPLLPRELATDLSLKGRGLLALGVGYHIGNETFLGRTANVQFEWPGNKPARRRVGWLSRDYRPFTDGTIGPAGVPAPIVRFQLHPRREGEVPLALPLDIPGGIAGALFGDWFFLDGEIDIGGEPVKLRFDPHSAVTLATAPTALAIKRAQGGTLTNVTGDQEIAYGIVRPYRVLRLARPLILGGIALSNVGVRITDVDMIGRDPVEKESAAQDPDEVVVVAKNKKRARKGIITLGADALVGCSEIVFDKPAKQVKLSCVGQGGLEAQR